MVTTHARQWSPSTKKNELINVIFYSLNFVDGKVNVAWKVIRLVCGLRFTSSDKMAHNARLGPIGKIHVGPFRQLVDNALIFGRDGHLRRNSLLKCSKLPHELELAPMI